jgi:hypothetical protein
VWAHFGEVALDLQAFGGVSQRGAAVAELRMGHAAVGVDCVVLAKLERFGIILQRGCVVLFREGLVPELLRIFGHRCL